MKPIILLLMLFQAMWFNIPKEAMPPEYDIREARTYAQELDPLYVENGIAEAKRGFVIHEYDVEADNWTRLPPSYIIAKIQKEDNEVHDTFKDLFTPPPGWRAGTARAYGEIVFNPQWHNQSYYWYQHPSWIWVVPHEMAHIYQGAKGYSVPQTVEWSAQVITMEIMASSDHPYAEIALVGMIREMLIGSALYEADNPRQLLETLQLQGGEYNYFLDYVKQCEISKQMCDLRANSYFRTPLIKVLADTNGVIEGAATLSGEIIIDDLKQFLLDNKLVTVPRSYRCHRSAGLAWR